MIRLEQRFQHHSQVVSTELDPLEAVLLHLESQKYYTLNETGWQVSQKSTVTLLAATLYWGHYIWSRNHCVGTVGLDEERLSKYVKYTYCSSPHSLQIHTQSSLRCVLHQCHYATAIHGHLKETTPT